MTAAAWSRYWRSGQTESCFAGGEAVIAGEVWPPFFARLAVGARILDLACGAGAVARQAIEAGRGFDVTGVDYAAELPDVPGGTLHPNTSIEALPFEDAAFDAVVSQYGFEYASARPAAKEAARMLAPGGQLQLLVHAAGARPVADARARLRRLDAPANLARATLAAVKAHAAGKPTSNLEQRAAKAWRAASEAEQDDTSRWAVQFFGDLWRRRAEFGAEKSLGLAEAGAAEIRGHRDRLSAMTRAALDSDGAARLCALFMDHGLVERAPAPEPETGDQIGWLIRAERPS